MKHLFLILTCIFIISCSDNNATYYCTKGTIRILNKDKSPCSRGSGYCSFSFYIYDGNRAYWYHTDERTYNSFQINDTLPTLVITKTINDK